VLPRDVTFCDRFPAVSLPKVKMKFRAVWEDSSEASEEEVEDNSLLDIIPRRVDKGKRRQVTVEDDEGSFEDGQTIEDEDEEEEEEEQSPETTPMRERRSARALVPTDHGDYVHPYEAEASNTRHTTPTGTRAVSISGMDVEQATPEPVPWPAQLGIEPHRVHVMQQSFFHTQNTRPQKTVEPKQQPPSFLLAAGRKRTREPSVQMIDAQEVRYLFHATTILLKFGSRGRISQVMRWPPYLDQSGSLFGSQKMHPSRMERKDTTVIWDYRWAVHSELGGAPAGRLLTLDRYVV
jgi:hypothetical protein